MSLVSPSDLSEVLDMHPKVRYTLLSVVMSIVFSRGISSLGLDLLRGFRSLFSTKYKDVEVQTLEIGRIPTEIHMNPGSEVGHFEGCHHLGVRAVSKRICRLCYNNC